MDALRALVRPFDLAHPVLSPSVVAFVRLVAAVWLLTGHGAILPNVRAPLLGPLAGFDGLAPWRFGLMWLGVCGVLVVWATPWLRCGAALIAASIGLALLSDLSWFSYNRALTAVLLGLVALMRERRHERWLGIQLAVVFAGAAWDKTWDADWRSGQFLQSFVEELVRHGQLWSPGGASSEPTLLARWAGTQGTALFRWTSVAVITLEWVLAWGFLRGRAWTAPLGAAFFAALVLLTGSSLGMFVYLGLLACVVVRSDVPDFRHWVFWAVALSTPLFSPALVLIAVAAISARRAGSAPAP